MVNLDFETTRTRFNSYDAPGTLIRFIRQKASTSTNIFTSGVRLHELCKRFNKLAIVTRLNPVARYTHILSRLSLLSAKFCFVLTWESVHFASISMVSALIMCTQLDKVTYLYHGMLTWFPIAQTKHFITVINIRVIPVIKMTRHLADRPNLTIQTLFQ